LFVDTNDQSFKVFLPDFFVEGKLSQLAIMGQQSSSHDADSADINIIEDGGCIVIACVNLERDAFEFLNSHHALSEYCHLSYDDDK